MTEMMRVESICEGQHHRVQHDADVVGHLARNPFGCLGAGG